MRFDDCAIIKLDIRQKPIVAADQTSGDQGGFKPHDR